MGNPTETIEVFAGRFDSFDLAIDVKVALEVTNKAHCILRPRTVYDLFIIGEKVPQEEMSKQ